MSDFNEKDKLANELEKLTAYPREWYDRPAVGEDFKETDGSQDYRHLVPEHFNENIDHYKVVYRSVAVLIIPDSRFSLKIGKTLTENECLAFLRQAHPYFKQLFEIEEEIADFRRTYRFIMDAWV